MVEQRVHIAASRLRIQGLLGPLLSLARFSARTLECPFLPGSLRPPLSETTWLRVSNDASLSKLPSA